MGLVVLNDLAFVLIDVKVKLEKKMKLSSSENCEKYKHNSLSRLKILMHHGRCGLSRDPRP